MTRLNARHDADDDDDCGRRLADEYRVLQNRADMIVTVL